MTHETPPDNATVVEYTWTGLRPGTFAYQSGTHVQLQVQMGLFGAVIKDAGFKEAYPDVFYNQDELVFFHEVDREIHEAVSTGNYGPGKAVSSTVYYRPDDFMVNGKSFATGEWETAGRTGETVLLRFVNMGLKPHSPILKSHRFSAIAEEARPYPFRRDHYSLVVHPGTTRDALITLQAPGAYMLYDGALGLNTRGNPGGGMALLIAALAARGQSRILNVEQIDRGYEAIEQRLLALGARIERISDEA